MAHGSYHTYRKKQRRRRDTRQVGSRAAVLIGLLGFLLALVTFDAVVLLRPDRLQILLEDLLADTIDGTISFQKVSLSPLHGLRLSGLSYLPEQPRNSLRQVTGDALVKLELASLLRGRVKVEKVTLDRLRLSLVKDPEEGWNFVWPVKSPDEPGPSTPVEVPEIVVRDGSVVVRDHSLLLERQQLVVEGVEAYLGPRADGRLFLSGAFRDRTFGAVELSSTIDAEHGVQELKLDAEGLFPTESFRAKLRPKLASYLETIGAKGTLNAELVIRPPDRARPTVPTTTADPVREWIQLRLWGNDLELTPPDFPYAFPDVEGSIVITPSAIKLERLHAVRGPSIFEASGQVEHYLESERMTGEVTLKTQTLQVDSWLRRALPSAGQDAWDALSPAGVVDLSLRVARELPDQPWGVDAGLDLRGLDVTYHGFYSEADGRRLGFPYPLKNLEGSVRVSRGRATLNLLGQTGDDGDVHLKGSMSGTPRDHELDLTVVAHVPLDDTLRHALKPEHKEFFDKVRPRGRTTAEISITRSRGIDEHVAVNVTADLHDADFSYRDFPYPVTNVEGRLVLGPELLRVRDLRGSQGPAEVRLDVDVVGPAGHARERIVIKARSLPLDEKLRHATASLRGQPLEHIWDDFTPRGFLDGTCILSREPGEDELRLSLDGKVHEGKVRFADFPVDLDQVAGGFVFHDSDLTLTAFEGRRGKARVQLAAELRGEGDMPRSWLALTAEDLEIDPEVLRAVRVCPVLPGQVIADLDPRGTIDVDCRFTGDPDTGALRGEQIEVQARDAAISHTWIPGRLTGVSGTVVAREGRVGLQGIRGTLREGEVEADGAILIDEDRATSFEATVVARNLRFHKDLDPETAVGKSLGRFELDGQLSSDGLDIRVSPHGARPRETVLEMGGGVHLHGMSANFGADITRELTGPVDIEKLEVSEAGYDFRFRPRDVTVRLLGYRFDGFSATIEGTEDTVRFSRMRGNLYGGSIETAYTGFQMHLTAPQDYEGRFRARGIHVDEFLLDQRGRAEGVSGLADLELEVRRGPGDGLSGIRGQGKLRVYDARLFAIPFLAQLSGLLPVSDPPVFTHAAVDFQIEDAGFHLDPLEIYSVPVAIKGTGVVDFGGELDLTLATRIAPDIPSIPLLEIPISLINESLFGIRVRGPIEAPVTRMDNLIFNTFRAEDQPRRPHGLGALRPPVRERF